MAHQPHAYTFPLFGYKKKKSENSYLNRLKIAESICLYNKNRIERSTQSAWVCDVRWSVREQKTRWCNCGGTSNAWTRRTMHNEFRMCCANVNKSWRARLLMKPIYIYFHSDTNGPAHSVCVCLCSALYGIHTHLGCTSIADCWVRFACSAWNLTHFIFRTKKVKKQKSKWKCLRFPCVARGFSVLRYHTLRQSAHKWPTSHYIGELK